MDVILRCTVRDEIMANQDLPRCVVRVLRLFPKALAARGIWYRKRAGAFQ